MRKIFLRITRGRSHSGNNQVKLAKRAARSGEFQEQVGLGNTFLIAGGKSEVAGFLDPGTASGNCPAVASVVAKVRTGRRI